MVITFKKFINEMNVSGAGEVFGIGSSMEYGGSVGNTDFHAPGDTRIPNVLGTYTRNGKIKGGKKISKRKKSRKRKKKK